MKTCLFVLALVPLCCETAAIASTPSFFDRRDYTHGYTDAFAIADANGDGIPDLIGVASGVGVQLGNGDGTFRTGPVSDIGMDGALSVLARDLNGDGKIDLVMSGGTEGLQLPQGVGVAFGNGDGTFQPVVFYQAGTDRFVTTAVIGDFNGDGIPDIAAQGDSGVWLFLGKSGGTFQAGVLIPVSGSGAFNILAAADVNGDGKLDLLPTTTGGFAVLLGNGNGTFQQQSNIAAKYPPGGISVGDLNGDGHPDVVFGNWETNYVWVYPGRGDGSFGTPISVYLPGTSTPAIGDVNGDGIPDLVSQDVSAWLLPTCGGAGAWISLRRTPMRASRCC